MTSLHQNIIKGDDDNRKRPRRSKSPEHSNRRYDMIHSGSTSPRRRSPPYRDYRQDRDSNRYITNRRSPSYDYYRNRSRSFNRRSPSLGYKRQRSQSSGRRLASPVPQVDLSTKVMLLREIVDLNKELTSMQSRILELEKNQGALKQLMFGGHTASNTPESSSASIQHVESNIAKPPSNFASNIERLTVEMDRSQQDTMSSQDNKKRQREPQYRGSRSTSKGRDQRANIAFPTFRSIQCSVNLERCWRYGAPVMLLLLVFICEDAIVNPWSKLAIRGIVSLLVIMFVGGLRPSDPSRRH